MSVFHTVTAATISGALAFGMILTLLGSLKLALARRFHEQPGEGSELEIAGLVFAFNLALVPMVLVSGLLLDWVGARVLLIFGSAVTALALLSLGLTARGKTNFWHAALASAFLGLGGAGLLTSSISLMPRAFFHYDPTEGRTMAEVTASAINVGMVFIALGAMIMPVLADLLLRVTRFRLSLFLLGLLTLAPMVLVLLTNPERFQPRQPYPWEVGGQGTVALLSPELWGDWRLWLVAAMCFAYLPVEFSINTWGTTFLRDHRYAEGTATYLLSGFWLMLVLGRLLVALAGWGHPWLLVVLGVLAAVCLGNMASSGRPGRALVGLMLLGLFLGPMFPTLIATLFNGFPDVPQGTAIGIIYASGALGALLLTPLIGLWAGRTNVRVALYLPLVLMVLLAALALMLAVSRLPSELREQPRGEPAAADAVGPAQAP